MTLWLLTPEQTRHKLTDTSFRPRFYVHTSEPRRNQLAQLLARRFRVACQVLERTDIWQGRALPVLEATVHNVTGFNAVVHFAHRACPQGRFYDSDLMLAPVYCWQKGVFALARVDIEADADGHVQGLACRDDPWALDYEVPPLRTLTVRLEGLARINPAHGRQGVLEVECDGQTHLLDDADQPAVASFARLLERSDPDLIVSEWGDSTILPGLLRQAERDRIALPLNRDAAPVQHSRARSYMSYGRILFKGSTTTLFGRLHVDTQNSFIADKCDLAGLWELARVTKLPVQYAARTTTGTGISYMQMELAWHDGVLIPEQKAEPEDLKSPDELLTADRGGLVFLPKLGLFTNVAELDFVSEYPSIMARFNISPETVNCPCCPQAPSLPELGYHVCQCRRGITSRVVERLIAKRQQWKLLQRTAPAEQARSYQVRRDALKWLLVCCFGYTGYKNARFGKIEAHEAINAMARETLLRAKEAAESRGFDLLHALVDSLYVRREGATRTEYEQLAAEIQRLTDLPIAVEALYRYVIFLPSRQFDDVPVPNRFFAVAEDGQLKVRGLECRRHDTPPLVARMQREVLAILAAAHDEATYQQKLLEARKVADRYLEKLREGEVAIQDLAISRRITRAPRDYQKPSHAAIAAQQLFGSGVPLRPGETVEYVITNAEARLPNDRVRAFALWNGGYGYDRKKYAAMLEEAFQTFTIPLDEAGGMQPAETAFAISPTCAMVSRSHNRRRRNE